MNALIRDGTPSYRDSIGLTGKRSTWKREAGERQRGVDSAPLAGCPVFMGSRNP